MFRVPRPLILFFALLLAGSCTQAPDIPRLPSSPRRPIEKILIDDHLGPTDVRRILHALDEDGSLGTVVKFFDDLPDDSIDGVTDVLNRWLYDDGRFQSLLARRFEQKEFSTLANWIEGETRFDGAEDRRALLFGALDDSRAPSFIRHLPSLLDPRILDAWRATEKRTNALYDKLPILKDKALPAKVAANDLWDLLTQNDRDSTKEVFSLLLQKDAGDDVYRGLKAFAVETQGARGFEGIRTGLQRMLEAPPESFQTKLERQNQLDILLHLAENAGMDSRGFFRDFNDGIANHLDLIRKKKTSMQMLVVNVYADRIRLEFSRPEYGADYWEALYATKSEADAVHELYQRVLASWGTVVGSADASSAAGYRLAVHLNAFVAAKWLYESVGKLREQMKGFKPGTPFARQFWGMRFSPGNVTVDFVKRTTTDLTFPQSGLMTNELAPIEELVEKFAKEKIEPDDRFSYQLVLDKTETTLSDALFDALRRIDRRREIIGAETMFSLAIDYLTKPDLGGGFILASFETERLLDFLNRVVLFSGLDRFRQINLFLFGDITVDKKDRKPGFLIPDNQKVILEIFSGSEFQERVQNMLWAAQSLAEFDYHETPDALTPFMAYRSVVAATHFDDKPHWLGETLVYLSKIRAAAKQLPGSDRSPNHPLFFDGLQSRSFGKKLFTFSQLPQADWLRIRTALLEWSDPDESKAQLTFLADALSKHQDGFVSAWDYWDQTPLPDAWQKLTLPEWEWFRDIVAHDDHSPLIRFFQGGTRKQWAGIARDLKRLHKDGSLSRILKLLALIQDDRLRDFSRVLLKADASGELGRLLDIIELAATPKS